ncbi:LysM peptidoglycan-binding domain-containing protein [Aspergillus mulundensis]|uniref:LysM domain-containing protein n=1 Tax=Aspergillus mulundensis TaxID=1810919 RepID=A0A3D8T5T2_9EURO|nr:hypothetical protein DSM5745_01212 [Aspergillus mulundensis]RDW93890.1 hypothetical protein DSM5745_01212 [Aspergillus mulundensis]
MYTRNGNFTAEVLGQMCTEQCKASLKSYREAVEAACANDEYDSAKNATIKGSSGLYKPIVLPDYYLTNYNQRCLVDGEGEYCILKLQNPEGLDKCDECRLRTLREKLNNGYFYADDLMEQYTSRTSSCEVTTIPTPNPSSVVISSAVAPTATAKPCEGRQVAIQQGDTCDSFAAANNVSTYRLLIDNKLQSGCANFPTEGSLCVIGSCQTHNVTKDDTCQGLASKYSITITQFRTWNQVLNSRCSNMDLLVGHMACVSYPGNATSTKNPYATNGAGGTATTAAPVPTSLAPDVHTECGNSQGVRPVGNIATYPGYATATGGPTTSRWTPKMPEKATAWSDLPMATLTPWTSLPTPSTMPLAKGTRKDCKEYADNTYGEVPCDWLTTHVSDIHFAEWNPSVVWWNCTLANNTRYCTLLGEAFIEESDLEPVYLDLPVTAAPNSTYDCYYWYTTEEGDTCDSVLEMADIALEAFYAWNPSVKSDCSNLWLDTSYCISGDGYDDTFYPAPLPSETSTALSPPPTPTCTCTCGTDTVSPSGRRALIPEGIYCVDIAAKYGNSLNTLYELHPALNGDCSGFWPDYAYCIKATFD